MKKLVLYHAHCNDGFGAAFVAFQKFGKEAEYRPVQYGDPFPKDLDGKEVFILDFSYPRAELVRMHEKASSLLVLDHHVTAQEDLRGLDFALFDLEQSGATMTWAHFFPDQPCPWLLSYIEDRDLWRWKLKHSDEVAAGLQSYRRSFSVWQEIIDRGLDEMIAEGRPILRYKKRLVQAAASRARMVELEGHRVPCVTSCILQSEIGSALAKEHPFVAITFEMEGRRVWSLRSDPEKGVDVAEIAKRHGGGGHKNAASFVQPIAESKAQNAAR